MTDQDQVAQALVTLSEQVKRAADILETVSHTLVRMFEAIHHLEDFDEDAR